MSNVPHTPRREGVLMTTAEAMDELERLRQRGWMYYVSGCPEHIPMSRHIAVELYSPGLRTHVDARAESFAEAVEAVLGKLEVSM